MTARPKRFVYRCYSQDGRLIYIGVTWNVLNRLRDHRSGWRGSELHHYKVTGPFTTPDAARAAERHAIATENPRYNRHGRWSLRGTWTADDYRDFYDAIRLGGFSGLQEGHMARTADECLRRFGVDITTTQKEAVR